MRGGHADVAFPPQGSPRGLAKEEGALASYHFSAQIIGRKAGRSVVAAAAYRAGARLHDERQGAVHNFAHRRGIAHAEILLPEGAAAWLGDRERLWNHVEVIERRSDAQLAREINMALPHELPAAERLALVRSFVREQFVSRGMVADIALHEPVPEKGDDPRNHHAHILLTLRQGEAQGLRRVKTREWNSDTLLTAWRQAWEVYQNRALEQARHPARVDHRSLEVQRKAAQARGDRAAAAALDRAPEIHVGPKARAARLQGRELEVSHERHQATARPSKGAWRSAKVRERRSRAVAYPAIDRGSRSAWNARIVAQNRQYAHARADKYERQAVRLRAREARAQKRLAVGGLSAGRLRAAQRHIRRSRSLLVEIERILARLLRMRLLWDQRHRYLVRDILGRGRDAGQGRSRDRS